MNRFVAGASIAVLALVASAAALASEDPLARYAAAWAKVNTYTCTITAHEVSGGHVQDRTYAMSFRKPSDTRMDVTGGDGRGGAAVWRGGDTVKGHQGGFLSFVKLNLSIHDSRATSIRGTTIADANFGALLDHLKGLKGASIDARADGEKTDLTVSVADPSADQNVTKELMVLGPSGLPVEFDQWEGATQVKKVVYSNVALNVPISDSTFNL